MIATSNAKESGETGSLTLRTGHWTEIEHNAYLLGLEKFGNDWEKISGLISTRSTTQIRRHARVISDRKKTQCRMLHILPSGDNTLNDLSKSSSSSTEPTTKKKKYHQHQIRMRTDIVYACIGHRKCFRNIIII